MDSRTWRWVVLALAPVAALAAGPVCVPPEASRDLLEALRVAIPSQLPPGPAGDPYEAWKDQAPPPPPPGSVCGVRFEPDQLHYRLDTFASAEQARAAGFSVTHTGACGNCSTLQDLAVYLEKPDLTAPVRSCGMVFAADQRLACIEAIGFTPACARTWFFNVRNTKRNCLWTCLSSWVSGEASTGPDGKLNACLQCDEDSSGPIFKAAAGRTRRNSGIRSSIPRPAEELAQVVHDYVPVPEPEPPPR